MRQGLELEGRTFRLSQAWEINKIFENIHKKTRGAVVVYHEQKLIWKKNHALYIVTLYDMTMTCK